MNIYTSRKPGIVSIIKSAMLAAYASLDDSARNYFAKYLVIDSYGTNELCWSMKEAQAWIPYCSDKAYILETYDYAVMVKRVQGA